MKIMKPSMKINWKLIGVCFAGISTLVGILMAYSNTLNNFDVRYAHAETTKNFIASASQQMKHNARRLDIKILEDQLTNLDNRAWKILSRSNGSTLSSEMSKHIHEIKREVELIKAKLKVLYSLTTQ